MLVSFYFLLTHDWQTSPEKIGLVSRLGRMWMSIRPDLPTPAIYPNFAAGIAAPLAPFICAAGLRSLRLGQRPVFLLWAAGLLVTAACLLLSATRGAWISCLGAAALLALWWLCLRLQALYSWRPERVMIGMLLAGLLLFSGYLLVRAGGLAGLLDALPGPKMAGSRLGLQASLIRLIADFPLTGGGLGSFPGLYAHYIEVNPNYILPHGHNLFLDVGLDQGVFGMGAVLWLFGASFWRLFKGYSQVEEKLLWAAALAGLTVFTLQAQAADDYYYTPLVFAFLLLPGYSAALTRRARKTRKARKHGFIQGRRWVILAVFLGGSLLLIAFRNPLRAALYANLGAVKMAIAEMPYWGEGRWQEPGQSFQLEPSRPYFEQALRYDSGNRTAHHRLGLIALLQGDFSRANEHLLAAYRVDPGHLGIRKNLGYSLAWSGQLEQSAVYLRTLPEAVEELHIYQWWWMERGRPDLAQRAEELRRLLSG